MAVPDRGRQVVVGRRNPRRGRPEHLWEAVDRQLVTGDLDQIPRLAIITVQHIYAAHAAAIQTGIGNPATKGIVRLARTSEPLAEQSELDQEPQPEDPASVASTWLDVARSCSWPRAGTGTCRRGRRRKPRRGAVRMAVGSPPTPTGDHQWPAIPPGCRRVPGVRWVRPDPRVGTRLQSRPLLARPHATAAPMAAGRIRGSPEVQRIIRRRRPAGVAARTNRRPRT